MKLMSDQADERWSVDMKKILLIAGIVLLAAGVLFLLLSGINWMVFKNTRDASNAFYEVKRKLAIDWLIAGGITSVIGILCFVLRTKVNG